MDRLRRHWQESWPYRAIINHKPKYEAIPAPLLRADGGHGDNDGNGQKYSAHKRKVVISFLLGFASASAITGMLAFVVATNTQVASRQREDVQQPGPSHSRFTFTPDWAGVVLSTPPPNQRFAAAKASLTIPHMTAAAAAGAADERNTSSSSSSSSSGLAEAQAVSIWLGIDANSRLSTTRGTTGLRTGLTLRAWPNGETMLEATYQWGTDGPHPYTKLGALAPGDTLQLEVVLFNETVAKAEIQNVATGRKATKYWAQPPPQLEGPAALSGQSVGWILEDAAASSQSPSPSQSLVDFGRVVLEHCIVWTDKDELLTADQGDVYRIRQNGVARTGVHVEDEAVFFTFIE